MSPEATHQLDDLRRRLSDLVVAVGVTDDGTEFDIAFRELLADPYHLDEPLNHAKMPKPFDHATMAKQFNWIAVSDNPRDPSICSGVVLTALNVAARRKWSRQIRKGQVNFPNSLDGMTFGLLSEQQRADVREIARDVAAYHEAQVQRRRPSKDELDTVLEELGDVYAEFTGFTCHRHHLHHAVASKFVRFCQVVLQPYFHPSEVTLKAISNRWKRLKDRDALPTRFRDPLDGN